MHSFCDDDRQFYGLERPCCVIFFLCQKTKFLWFPHVPIFRYNFRLHSHWQVINLWLYLLIFELALYSLNLQFMQVEYFEEIIRQLCFLLPMLSHTSHVFIHSYITYRSKNFSYVRCICDTICDSATTSWNPVVLIQVRKFLSFTLFTEKTVQLLLLLLKDLNYE